MTSNRIRTSGTGLAAVAAVDLPAQDRAACTLGAAVHPSQGQVAYTHEEAAGLPVQVAGTSPAAGASLVPVVAASHLVPSNSAGASYRAPAHRQGVQGPSSSGSHRGQVRLLGRGDQPWAEVRGRVERRGRDGLRGLLLQARRRLRREVVGSSLPL